jgi:hypothetical protein
MCRAFKVDVIGFLSPLRGWLYFPLHTHGLRRGLRSTAASRLGFGGTRLELRGTRVEFGGLGLGFGG